MAHPGWSHSVTRTQRQPDPKPQSLVLVRAARQLVTLHGPSEARRGAQMSQLAVINDGALLIRNGRIEDVGPTRRIERLKSAQNAVEIDATGSVVMPAFVDHCVRPVLVVGKEAKRATLEANTASVLAGMARHGTLAAQVHADCNVGRAVSLRLLRVYKALQGRPASLIPSLSLSDDTAAQQALQSAAGSHLIAAAAVVLENKAIDPLTAHDFLSAARALRLRTIVQAGASTSSVAAALALESDTDAVSGLESLPGVLIRLLARSKIVAGIAPAVAYAQGRSNFAPARQLIDQGGALALATHFDRAGNQDYNMLHTMSLACRYTGISCAEAVTAATVNASYASGCAAERGTLEPGKLADLVLFDCQDYSELIHTGAVNQVVRVLKNGSTVYRRARVEEVA